MTTESGAIEFEAPTDSETIAVSPTNLSGSTRGEIFIYLSILLLLLGFGSPGGGLIGIPISFFLKNKLHLHAHDISTVGLITGIPLFLSFAFGLVRDTWSPLGLRDRGYMIVFGVVCAAIYVAFAFIPVSYWTLVTAILLLTSAFLFVSSAQNGLMATIGQQHLMSGQISTVFNIVASLPGIAALMVGGWLSNLLEGKDADAAARILFLTGAAIMLAIALYGLWKPKSVFDNLHGELGPKSNFLNDFGRLLRYWPVYPALLIWGLWNFAPGSATPLQFFMQNTLHSSDADWANWNAIFTASFIPTFMLYGLLCRKYSLQPLLWWGAVIAVPQMVPLLFIHSVAGALLAAIPIGLMGGLCSAAYVDLTIRSCPRGLQGTMLMASGSLYFISARFGDKLGTILYDRYHDFTVCVIAITVVYALIVPVLLLVPKRLITTADGEAPDGGFATQ